MQSSYEAELMPSDWLCNTSEENKKAEVSLEATFQVAAEVHSSCKAEKVGVAPVESQNSILELNGNQALPVNSYTPSSTEESQLECLTPVTSDTSFLVAADGALDLSPLQPSDILCAADTTLSIETAAAAKILQELLTTQEADEERSKEPDHRAAEFSLMFFQEELSSPEQENTSVKSESRTAETEERQFTSGAEPVNESVEQTDSSVKSFSQKRHSSYTGSSLDLRLLVDAPWKRGCFLAVTDAQQLPAGFPCQTCSGVARNGALARQRVSHRCSLRVLDDQG
ncbi:heat shock factor protein 5-like isoform X2 [Falco biarmicus]|nr:heat shock factor protein 5-like isoform X2 [Falco biarmicus]